MTKNKKLVHGIDITAPGGIQKLMDFHRVTFGDATMETSLGEGGPAADATTTDATTDDAVTADTDVVDTTDASAEVKPDEKDTDLAASVEKWKSQSRKNEDKAKANFSRVTELEAKLTKLETDTKDFNKLTEDNLNLRKKIVAIETGLPTDSIDRLRGSTDEELRKDAELLKSWFSAASKNSVQPVTKQGTDADSNFVPVKFSSLEEHKKYLNQIKQ